MLSDNFHKIYTLEKALNAIGVDTELVLDAEWYCIDNKTHYGIELLTNIPSSEYEISFCFTPSGTYITDCTKAPTNK